MESDVVSTFFTSTSESEFIDSELCDDFLNIVDALNFSLQKLHLPSAVECVYNATIYARRTFEMYVRKYCNTKKSIMYFGMNPGPWGMSQTGVPFGEISAVRNWLGIEGPVDKPPNEIAARPVKGFNCTRTEISGKRFWGLFRTICGTPEKFFESSFVYNYLPQQWMKSNGCNLTPGDFKVSEMKQLYSICDPIFCKVLELYDIRTIVAIGKFCEARAQKSLKEYLPHRDIKVLYMPHPSPRTVNNNNWEEKAIGCLKEFNLLHLYTNETSEDVLTNRMQT